EDKARLAGLWNSARNNYKPIEYHKIPVGFARMNTKFKGGALSIRPAQREGVAFMNSRGTGIIAYDVGVGKTMTAIWGIDDAFSKGLFKRPLLVVPQKVYQKWIDEIIGVEAQKDIYQTINGERTLRYAKGSIISEGILPGVEVNGFDNLGVDFIKRTQDEEGKTKRVAPYSITIVTFEGLVKIGFNQETEKGLAKRLNEALSQGESGRAAALQNQKMGEWIDQALSKTEVDIEALGIDAIIVDEAHNFRNLFMEVKGDVGKDGEREKRNFFSGGSAKPSARALSLFMLNAYIQDKHQRRNTFGLTATPFSNRATEIYSMLSLYDYLGMKDFDCYNIAQFCTTYIDETMEDAWTAAGRFEPKAVIRGYNNLPTLQAMIFRSINYKTGEQAKIERPQKVVLPLTHDERGIPMAAQYIVDTKLQPSDLQAQWLKEIRDFASRDPIVRKSSKLDAYYKEDERGNIPGQTLIALNASRAVTFSPYTLALGGERQYQQEKISPETFVDNSPKVKYAIECIRSVVEYHKTQGTAISGQIIYADRGREWFTHIKAYLMKHLGFVEEQVQVFHGSVSKLKRERIKQDFLAGKVKVLIGTSTMREGVDLQKVGSTMYICHIDWNPTDVHQLFGRIWRFGNRFSHVRLVIPLIENSSDIFTWQKLSEKMSRLNSIWQKADGTKLFEESELNAEELKRGLINDPLQLAELEVEEKVASVKTEMTIVSSKLTELKNVHFELAEFDQLTEELQGLAKEAITDPQVVYGTDPKKVEALQKMEMPSDQKGIYRIVRAYAKLKGWRTWQIKGKVGKHIKLTKQLDRLERDVLAAYELKLRDNVQPVIDNLKSQEEQLSARLENLQSDDFLQETQRHYEQLLKQQSSQSQSLQHRVQEFARLNYLLDCQHGIHNCDIYGRIEIIPRKEDEDIREKIIKAIKGLRTLAELKQDSPEYGRIMKALKGLQTLANLKKAA
ncbi:MAG: DEAD/DEAH box helicase, partial [Bacteroidota bacterium]